MDVGVLTKLTGTSHAYAVIENGARKITFWQDGQIEHT
jgi:hypothetical protein